MNARTPWRERRRWGRSTAVAVLALVGAACEADVSVPRKAIEPLPPGFEVVARSEHTLAGKGPERTVRLLAVAAPPAPSGAGPAERVAPLIRHFEARGYRGRPIDGLLWRGLHEEHDELTLATAEQYLVDPETDSLADKLRALGPDRAPFVVTLAKG